MNPLDTILTSLVDAAFPIVQDEPENLNDPQLLHFPNPIAYGQTEAEDCRDE